MIWAYIGAAVFLAFCIGRFWGSRCEAAYWVMHEGNGGCVHHRGKFYRVFSESDAVGMQIARMRVRAMDAATGGTEG